MIQTNLRDALRVQTRTDHDQLDRMVTTLDIAKLADFILFLQLHHRCFTAIKSQAEEHGRSRKTLSYMIDGLAADLSSLSSDRAAIDLPLLPQLDPLSIDYMVAGSRLGSKILRKRWSASTDQRVQRADSYFGQAVDPNLWPETCRALSEVPMGSARADKIVDDTKTQFQLFATAFAKIALAEGALL